jgi:hypothetical protein
LKNIKKTVTIFLNGLNLALRKPLSEVVSLSAHFWSEKTASEISKQLSKIVLRDQKYVQTKQNTKLR